jgi:hypothetical protein
VLPSIIVLHDPFKVVKRLPIRRRSRQTPLREMVRPTDRHCNDTYREASGMDLVLPATMMMMLTRGSLHLP